MNKVTMLSLLVGVSHLCHSSPEPLLLTFHILVYAGYLEAAFIYGMLPAIFHYIKRVFQQLGMRLLNLSILQFIGRN